MPKITKIEATPKKLSGLGTSLNKKRVCAYARVSSDSDEQYTSYVAQRDYYQRYIKARPEWEFVEVYSDEGISGTSLKNRDGFNKMIQEALNGKIDLIITKSISRFARNTVDSLTTIRKLKEKGVEVYFEKENIFTMNSSGELLITILSSLAQEESHSLSENVKWGYRKAFSDGNVYLPYGRFLGYKRGENGKPEIIPEQAETVRLIYSLFIEGKSITEICNILNKKAIPTPGEGKRWSHSTVRSILKNEKYKGDALLQKGYVEDFLTHKRVMNKGEVPQYYVEGSHPAIIDPAEWEIVQLEFKRREKSLKAYSGASIFSNRIICEDCGSYYGPKVWHSTDKYRCIIWQCNSKFSKEHKSEKCDTPHIKEEQIKKCFIEAYNILGSKRESVIEDCEFMISLINDFSEIDEKISSVNDELEVVKGLAEKLNKKNVSAPQDQVEYKKKYSKLEERYTKLQLEASKLEAERVRKQGQVKALQMFLENYKKQPVLLTDWSDAVWMMTVERVVVTNNRKLKFRFYTGSEVEVGLV